MPDENLQRASGAIIAKGSGILLLKLPAQKFSAMHNRKVTITVLGFALCTALMEILQLQPEVRAQLPPPNPLVAPLAAPSGPAQLPAPVQTNIAPVLIAVPSPPAASPTPVSRVFNCSCFGPASGTHWMGQVSSTGYFAARQTATGACLTYNEQKQPAPPVLGENGVASLAAQSPSVSLPPGFNPVNQAGTVQPLPNEVNLSTGTQTQLCSNCVCD